MRKLMEQVIAWMRYIGDLFVIWTWTSESAEKVAKKYNDNELTFCFTSNIGKGEVTFLHLTVYISKNKVEIKIF